jgi:hypothetical protein
MEAYDFACFHQRDSRGYRWQGLLGAHISFPPSLPRLFSIAHLISSVLTAADAIALLNNHRLRATLSSRQPLAVQRQPYFDVVTSGSWSGHGFSVIDEFCTCCQTCVTSFTRRIRCSVNVALGSTALSGTTAAGGGVLNSSPPRWTPSSGRACA